MIRTKKFFYRFFHLATPYFNLSIWMMCLEYIMWSYGYDGPCQWQTQLNNKIENERKFIWDPLSCCTLTKQKEEKKTTKWFDYVLERVYVSHRIGFSLFSMFFSSLLVQRTSSKASDCCMQAYIWHLVTYICYRHSS